MKKSLLISILLFFGVFLAEGSARAANFTFVFDGQDFKTSAEIVSAWEGPSLLARQNQFLEKDLFATDLLKKLSGQKNTRSDFAYYSYRADKIYGYLKGISDQLNAPAVEPTLKIENNKAIEFTPPQTGRRVDLRQTTLDALAALERGRTTSTITVIESEPKTSLMQLNDLGIYQLIGRGESNFKGSPKNRRHNITVGVEKFKGVILAKGEEFSFNKYLGPVEKENGFLPELVIKKTGTVPELGGGLCQVSSTTFRAAMNAGLPITQRRNHAYAVQYYSPQGTDATIYPGVVDLKFINDTPGNILIWPYLKDKDTLIFDFYGNHDDRQVVLKQPLQWDRRADGSMKASWTREVIKNGTTTVDTFKSTYLPPALFHKEETYVHGTSTPATENPPPAADAGTLTQTQ